MSLPRTTSAGRSDSPDPASHTANIYDDGDFPDTEDREGDDDDIDFHPTETESEDLEYFETGDDGVEEDEDDDEEEEDEEGSDGEFHGTSNLVQSQSIS